MPIVPAFNPSTGASGGPAVGGSASLYDLPFDGPINLTDGSWTLVDPDGLVQSVSCDASGWHTVAWNALGAGSPDYNWASSTTIRSPRWHKAAEVDGTRLTSDDVIQGVFYAEADNTNRGAFDSAFVHGIAADPTSTTATTMAAAGLYATALAAGSNTAIGVFTVNGAASTAVGSSDRGMTTYQYGGQHVGSGCFTVLDATGTRIQNGSRNATVALSTGIDLSWVVGVGTRANTTTIAQDDESQRFRLWRKAIKLNLAGVL